MRSCDSERGVDVEAFLVGASMTRTGELADFSGETTPTVMLAWKCVW